MATAEDQTSRENLPRDISRALVAIYKEAVGRGPTRVRTYVEGNLVITLFRGTMTTAERTLADGEEQEAVRDLRRILQEKFRDDASDVVARLTGRKVIAYLSDHDVDPDYAIEAFVLAPGLGEEDEPE
jgi:uncharacterized protein YbcI